MSSLPFPTREGENILLEIYLLNFFASSLFPIGSLSKLLIPKEA
jgi:hypothetical protein